MNKGVNMQYNKCSQCGAKDGRAGNLFSSPTQGYENLCENCRDTFVSGNFVLHSHLSRTDDEVDKTGKILK